MLSAAGIDVTEGVLGPEAARLNAGFLKRVTQGLPFVTLKLAGSLDGRTATATGESRWITGPEARRKVHAMRMAHDAVMVGSGTALADDPDLTVRDMGAKRQPVRIVLDRMLRHAPESRLGRTAKDHPVWLLHGPSAPEASRKAWATAGATLIETREADGRLDLGAALRSLAATGLTRILSEGGATLAAALVRAGLVDDLVLFSGGVLIGGDGHPALGNMGVTSLGLARRPVLHHVENLGPDTCSHWSLTAP
jgi:diaminohydroxyphosphoribosylaminopyrimidine deaminase/5-amino-6-(5-phosphoribosylamino)uracil reductase